TRSSCRRTDHVETWSPPYVTRMIAAAAQPAKIRGNRHDRASPTLQLRISSDRIVTTRTSATEEAITSPYESLGALRDRATAEVGKVVFGQERAVELLLVAALAHGHVLLEGPPGSAKTLLGRAVAYVLGAEFKRVQF